MSVHWLIGEDFDPRVRRVQRVHIPPFRDSKPNTSPKEQSGTGPGLPPFRNTARPETTTALPSWAAWTTAGVRTREERRPERGVSLHGIREASRVCGWGACATVRATQVIGSVTIAAVRAAVRVLRRPSRAVAAQPNHEPMASVFAAVRGRRIRAHSDRFASRSVKAVQAVR